MHRRPQQTAVEAGFLALLAGLCVLLAALQYHWTGELGRAAAARMRAGLGDGAQQLARAFDAELAESCNALVPRGEELPSRGREEAHLERLRAWLSGKPRPIFRRLAVAVPEGGGGEPRLYWLDEKSQRLLPAEWPVSWTALRDNLSRKTAPRGSPPFANPTGALIEFPIFGDPRQTGGPESESEWMILELDLDYARTTWLPDLVRTYLNAEEAPALHDVIVRTRQPQPEVLFATGGREPERGASVVSLSFNQQGRAESDRRAREVSARWVLTAWHPPGVLEAAVSASRRRNLVLACVLIGLVLASGVALVGRTPRARGRAGAAVRVGGRGWPARRPPLTVIRGAAHNLARGVVRAPARVEQYARLIVQHADGLTGMIEQVLELAAAEKKQAASGPYAPVALAEILRAAIAATTPDTSAGRCEVNADIPADLPAVNGDAAALRRAFQNLLTNAAKHGGGRDGCCAIRLTAKCVNGTAAVPALEVEIADRGPGIPREEQAKIFQPFYRGAAAREQETRGSGLGLSLVREIVEAHGGSVSVRSRRDEGATFTVRLPFLGAEETAHLSTR